MRGIEVSRFLVNGVAFRCPETPALIFPEAPAAGLQSLDFCALVDLLATRL
jgi:hypothetical protein